MLQCCAVLMHKSFRFRVYPTPAQVARLLAWESALRWLWNLAHEQRLMGLARPKDERIYPTAFDQINELTELCAMCPWLADVPRNVCAQLLISLDKAWQRFFRKLGMTPRWKRKGRDVLGICEHHPKVWRLDGDSTLRFPKLGTVRIVQHRPLEGKPKTCTLKRDGDQWFASIVCEVAGPTDAEIAAHRALPPVGLDRGVVNLVADSNGGFVKNPKRLDASKKRLARAQREVSRRRKGSKNREKSKARVARIHRTIRRQRDHVLHVASHAYAKNHGTVFVERLNLKGMMKSASGTVDEPGTNVAQKRGLNRSLSDAAMGRFAKFVGYKITWRGGRLGDVRAAYSSQECNGCEHIDPRNRPDQATFLCVACGLREHADVNAAKVILKRGLRAVEPTVTGCGGSGTSRPARQQLRVVRRGIHGYIRAPG